MLLKVQISLAIATWWRTCLTGKALLLAVLTGQPLLATASQLEEVTVTAQKRPQNVQMVPLAITAITAADLNKNRIQTLSNITAMTPNVQAALPNGEVLPIFSIRGISMADYSVNQSSPIGVYLDEVYLSSNYSHGLQTFDVDRIEVLRGPQGTLYGKNTTAGAINIISKTPDFSADGFLTLGIGNYQQQTIDAAYETPLIEQQLSARLALSAKQAEGFAENHTPGAKDLSATDRHALRLTINYQASEQWSAVLKLNSGRSQPETQAVIPNATFNGIDYLSAQLAAANQPFYTRPDSYDSFDADSNKVDTTDIKTDGGSLTVSYDSGQHTLTSISGFYRGDYDHRADSDGTPQQLLEIDYLSELKQWSQDLRISSNHSDTLWYTVGLYFNKEQIETDVSYDYYHGLQSIVPNFVAPLTGIVSGFSQIQRYEQERSSQAIYGEMSFKLNTAATLTSGLRYTEDKNSQFNVHSYITDYDQIPQFGLIPFTAPYDPNAVHPRQQFTDREWSGKLALDYQWDDRHLFYASYNRGYRSGAFNGAATTDASELTPVEPEYVNAYELGIKGETENGRVRYNTALFYYDYRNQQFINVVGTRQLLDSADRSTVRGLELELHAIATSALTIHLGLGWLDSEYKNGPNLDAQGQSWDLSSNQLIAAPDYNANLAADYALDLASLTLFAHLDLNYQDQQWFTAFNDTAGYEDISQASYTLVNAQLAIQPHNSPLIITVWGKNLGDKSYKTYAINLSESFGYHYTMYGPPRTFGIDASWQF
ncbi:TonB-dependent receptor [Oceanicoccus sp. KOV_DT_Chl]|uniref:TonB-dependent receptor n=1 Tax=Oceanicoccus sp. KOV_DT_Chl TaxID=1904639 RepID=UPI0011AEFCAC|nr:TonB-dependent receptor [Oceanicoccus sp. KOV_DT_Chl]